MTPRPSRLLAAATVLTLGLALSACGGDEPTASGSGSPGGAGRSGGASDLQLVHDGTLTVCSDIPYPPFDVLDGDTFTGFDGDLMTEIAEGLGLTLVAQDSGFDALQSGLALNSGQCDLVASAMGITAEREKKLDFTDGYYAGGQSLLVPTGSDIASIEDLSGRKVGVQQGTTGKAYTEAHAPDDAEVVSFPSDAEMYSAIKAGQVDALLQDFPVNLDHQKDGGFEIVQQYDTDEDYGFAVKQGNTALRDAVDAQLERLRANGRYDEVYAEYFSLD